MNAPAWPVVAFLIAGALLPPLVGAQTCAAPLRVYQRGTITGSSCGQNLLPALNHGTVFMAGDDIVYHVPAGHAEGGATAVFVTTDDPNFHPALFLCSAPCGSESQCVSASDSGSAVAIPQDENEYYLIVDSQVGCGDYSLTINGFFDAADAESEPKQ